MKGTYALSSYSKTKYIIQALFGTAQRFILSSLNPKPKLMFHILPSNFSKEEIPELCV